MYKGANNPTAANILAGEEDDPAEVEPGYRTTAGQLSDSSKDAQSQGISLGLLKLTAKSFLLDLF